jgi:integrase
MEKQPSTSEQPLAEPAPAVARAAKPRPAKRLPRGITEVRWENATTHDSVRYRVRIKRKDFKADELFESVQKAQEFLLMSKTRDGRLGLTERERQAKAMEEVMREMAERRPFRYYINDYIAQYVDTKPEPNEVKKRSKATLRNRLRNLRELSLTWKPPAERARMGMLAKFGRSDAELRRLGDFYLDEIDVAVANDFLRTRVKTHKSSTVKRELGDLQTIWARLKHLDPAAAKRLPAENPWKEAEQAIIQDSGEKRERHLSDEEEFRLLVELVACRNKDMPCIVGLALATGMRRGEVLMLEWGQINEEEGYLRLAPSQTKAKRSRYVALTPDAMAWIADKRERLDVRQPKATERLFAYTVDGFKSVWNRVVVRAKVENLRFHDTRRTAITEMLRKMANPSPVAVKRLTGMQSVDHIEREFVIPFEERQRASEGRFNSEKDIRANVGHSDARMTDHYANLSELGKADDAL